MDVSTARKALRDAVDPEKAIFLPRFFKAGPGEYAEGDKFLGVTVPQQRAIAKQFKDLSLADVTELLTSEWHEERLTALFILVGQHKRADGANKKAIYDLYMAHTKWINNWDLVDSSAGYIVGAYLDGRPEKMKVLTRLAASDLLWERRIAMIATFNYIYQGRADEALIIAEQLLYDKHDLIQKAVGWMLREIAKRVDHSLLAAFLDEHAATMPRTSLRYALEHFSAERKAYYMQLAKKQVQ
ncbi:DNA alkylation repair protein [Candidatus Saccharibacteria bacterium]|nr:MAG: DNA alkylation repair protein [Candidatus Saccharibacteria bacterium]